MEQITVDFIDPETYKSNIRQGKINHFICYLPLPNGKEFINLGNFIFDGKQDPSGEDILSNFDKDDLEDEVEALEHDAPNTTPEEFWEAYDACRVNPSKLIWELLSPEAAILSYEKEKQVRENFLEGWN